MRRANRSGLSAIVVSVGALLLVGLVTKRFKARRETPEELIHQINELTRDSLSRAPARGFVGNEDYNPDWPVVE